MSTPLLEIRGLVKHFELPRGARFWRQAERVHAVNGVDLDVGRGEIVAVVGESGSGKTTLANCVAGFVEPTAGLVSFDGSPLVEVDGSGGRTKVIRHQSRRAAATLIQMVFQDPSSALNPRQKVGPALLEPVLVHDLAGKDAARVRVVELLERAGLSASIYDRYPHELNSGQRQRVVIARALTLRPQLLVADEPVSKLDVSTQGQILNLLLELHRDLGLTIVFITHDLSAVRQVADRVVVMYLGRVMESADAESFFAAPLHPYSEALLGSTPRFAHEARGEQIISGEIPSPIHPPPGCPFSTRCPLVEADCEREPPPLHESADSRLVACIKR
jgi:peptide/nickel transport system ATP-binding protein